MKREISRLQNPFAGGGIGLSKAVRQTALGALVLTLGMTAISAPPYAGATPLCASLALRQIQVGIYLYDENSQPVLTLNAYFSEGGIYTDSGFIGFVDEGNNIVDINDVIVGYIVSSGGIGR